MMKTIVAAALLALAGCQSSTNLGPCVGVTDDKNPALNYRDYRGHLLGDNGFMTLTITQLQSLVA